MSACLTCAGIIKNNVLYIDGGMQSFIGVNSSGSQAGNISMGYSEQCDTSKFVTEY